MRFFGVYLWLFHGLSIGYYHPYILLGHIPLWCTGYLIRDKAKSPKARWIWIGIFATAILFGELACHFWLQGYDRLAPIILLTGILDLLIGFFIKDVWRPIRALIDWIKKDESEAQEDAV